MGMGVCGIKVHLCVLFDICANDQVAVFRMVVFRLFTSEVVIAKVKSSDDNGIRCTSPSFLSNQLLATLSYTVTIGFFNDMHIPAAYLPQPSTLYVVCPPPLSLPHTHPTLHYCNPNECTHFWIPSPLSPPPSPSTSPTFLLDSLVSLHMYIDQGEILCVWVEVDQFSDDEPGPQKFVEGIGAEAKGRV